jgi:predicted ferric reductase
MVTIWIHLKHRYRLNGFLLIAAIGLLLLTTLLYLARHLFRSIKKGQSLAIADIERLEDAVRLTFRPSRAWKVKAGEYVYIRAPGLRLLSFAESHPFNIIWWEENGSDGKAGSISVLAKIQSGLTRDLFASSHKSFRLLVDGPYGKPLDTTHCDSIIFVATDIGIAAQLPYVQDLILRRGGADRKRRISVIWELEYEGELPAKSWCHASYLIVSLEHQDWICDWMDYLLDKDQEDLVSI